MQRRSADLDYSHEETNFTLGLTDLLGRLNRRWLIVLMTDFVDTIAAELMLENVTRLAQKHLVIFVTLQDPAFAEDRGAAPGAAAGRDRKRWSPTISSGSARWCSRSCGAWACIAWMCRRSASAWIC